MRDANKIQKLLNLTSSTSDAEALAALRMAQKLLSDGGSVESNLGDFLAGTEGGLKRSVSEDLYNELEDLFEIEVAKAEVLKKALVDRDKSIRKYQRDVMNLKRDLQRAQVNLEIAERTNQDLTLELMSLKGR